MARPPTVLRKQSTGRPAPTRRRGPRIGIHTSIAGGVDLAAERAHQLGCAAFQIFSASPRQWSAARLDPAACTRLRQLRETYDLRPLVIHTNYLINLAGDNGAFHTRSLTAFRGELERAAALDAEFLVMHPGSAGTGDRTAATERLARSIRAASEGFDWGRLRLLIENTAGGGAHLGGTFEELADLLSRLQDAPVGACIDTCHCWAAGYDLRSEAGYEATLTQLEKQIGLERVFVIHANDSKGKLGSHLDRHQNIGEGELGRECFRRLVNDPRLAEKAFILETPIDQPGDDRKNVQRLQRLVL